MTAFQSVYPLPGQLHLSPGTGRALSLIERILVTHDVRHSVPAASQTITADILAREFSPVLSTLAASLSDKELEECSAIFIPANEVLGVRHLSESRSLRRMTAEVQGHWLWELMRNDRISCHFQPIVTATEPLQVFGYECLMRATDMRGRMIYPDRLLRAAKDAGLLPILEMTAHLTAIRETTTHKIEQPIFINVSPSTAMDPLYDPGAVITAARHSGRPPEQFVFEITESESATDLNRLLRFGKKFRRLGVRFALDDLGAGYASLNMLTKLHPDFVKLDIQLIRDLHQDDFKSIVVSKLVEMAQDLGIAIIAEGIETQEEWEWVLDAGIGYGQGYLFARPAADPPLLGGSAPQAKAQQAVHRLLHLYLVEAQSRLLRMAEYHVTAPESGSQIH